MLGLTPLLISFVQRTGQRRMAHNGSRADLRKKLRKAENFIRKSSQENP